MDSPYISFIVVARNDNYGGDFLHRVNIFVKDLLTLCEKHELGSELIIIEWNPPEKGPRLKDAILWPDIRRKYSLIRLIEVPNKIHKKLPNPARLPLFEYIGKNVGIRRAKGEYILSTNPDIIFSKELINFLASGSLSQDCFYRAARYDVKIPVPLDIPVERQHEYCEENIIRVHGSWYSYENKLSERLNPYKPLRAFAGHLKQRLLFYPLAPPDRNASGDFFLMHRNHWNSLRAYPEFTGKPHQIDGIIVDMALFNNLEQVTFARSLRLYHQDHTRPESGKPRSPEVELAYEKLMKERKPIIFNNELWGLGKEPLPEQVL